MNRTAVLITTFNRKSKTLGCLRSIRALKGENCFGIYVVDGGSTDGTVDAVRAFDPDIHVSSHPGLFWAGGMIQAWKDALAGGAPYDYFFLVNDDTVLLPDCMRSLLGAEGLYPGGIYVGATYDPDTHKYSYGGMKLKKPGSMKADVVLPSDSPQAIDMGNANIMLVSGTAFEKLGMLSDAYTHGIADYDYTLRAVSNGVPVVLAAGWCGECKDDHGDSWLPQTAPLSDRLRYLYSPKGLAYKEYLFWVRRFFPGQYVVAAVKLWMKTLFPVLWEKFKK